MNSFHFKNYFENYFNYSFEKLEFFKADSVKFSLAQSYGCSIEDVDCFFLFRKLYSVNEFQFYGFYRIIPSNFYIPFFAHSSKRFVTPHVEITFNYDINNSVFDYKHVPLKKEMTRNFYQGILDNIQPRIKTMIAASDLFSLSEPYRKSTLYFDFDFRHYSLEVTNRGSRFSEFFSISNKDRDNESASVLRYELNYYINKKAEQLHLITMKPEDYNQCEMFKESFKGITDFAHCDYTTIEELDDFLKDYRKIEAMYNI